MKKLVLIAIMLLVPFTAFALESMDDAALDEMTAQDGVTITFDNVVITQTASDMAWGDTDGLGSGSGAEGAGWIYLDQSGTGSTYTLDGTSLTIDVATVDAGADLRISNNDNASVYVDIPASTTFVKVGLPSVSIGQSDTTTVISMGNTNAPSASGTVGTMFRTGGSSTVSGDIYIYAHQN